ncbi:PrsW family glutamic-type intramembrane protease [Sphingomonas hankyongi]|uniref:PrsW family glutamic-type intramembrane protease n=1 Tax=Sphingomonas hankyongi TaxID=2908209 RepID=A0ABT0S1K9_9SPHN|nr:PrsW family glutamic-type intramembrane protease [Sphingomonas hankyongi]MCL6729745.1 PrsW family glutamic-type intramembrane protease [Sphingomonas hankyongi]
MLAIQAAHWALALVPVLILLVLFVWFDAFKLMSFREIILLLALGGVAGIAVYPISGRLIDALPIGFSNYSRFLAPWIEEAFKAASIILLFGFNRIGYKLDAVISGFAIGAGFSVVENIIYLTIYPDYGASTWLVRGLGTAVMHGTTLAIFAAIAHELAERETREAAGDFDFSPWWFVPGFFLAVAIHMVFNQFPDRPLLAMLGAAMFAPIAIVAIFSFGTAEAQSWLVAERAEHKAQLETLRAGKWPDSTYGKKIATLSERLGADATTRIRRYWELQAYLVGEAEETLLEEAAGDAEYDPAEIRAAFAELDELRGTLGAGTYAELKRLLPFSRNDYWEVDELRQRLRSDAARGKNI